MPFSLYDKLIEYKGTDNYPFHMPGHKQGRLLFTEDIFKADITEIPGFDNLGKPEGAILRAQQRMAKTFGADRTFFLVNGSSCGVMAAVMAVCREGEQILVARNCHKSVFNAVVLSGAEPVFVTPEILDGFGFCAGVLAQDVEKAIEGNPLIKAVVITSPTYEGIVSDVKGIAEAAHKNNKILIVDEAHGAHFAFSGVFPDTALSQGADIVIQSTHKTLPAPTQTALLHIKGERADAQKIGAFINMFQTTSPSYIFMGALDKMRQYLDLRGSRDFKKYCQMLMDFRQRMEGLRNIRLLDDKALENKSVKGLDYGKLVFSSRKISGKDMEIYLLKRHKIMIEASSLTHVILISSVADEKEGFQRLEKAMYEMDSHLDYKKEEAGYGESLVFARNRINLKAAFYSEKEECPLGAAVGRISGEFVIPYPPGIPVIMPGDVIDAEVVGFLKKSAEKGINIICRNNNRLEKIVVLV